MKIIIILAIIVGTFVLGYSLGNTETVFASSWNCEDQYNLGYSRGQIWGLDLCDRDYRGKSCVNQNEGETIVLKDDKFLAWSYYRERPFPEVKEEICEYFECSL